MYIGHNPILVKTGLEQENEFQWKTEEVETSGFANFQRFDMLFGEKYSRLLSVFRERIQNDA